MTNKTSTTAVEFTVSLQDFARIELLGDIKTTKMAIAFDLFRGLVLATPVGNPDLWRSLRGRKPPKGYVGGTARASWFVTPTRPSAYPVVQNPPNKSAVNAEGESQLANLKESKQIWIANNLPYIERIMEDGWSTQAPPGSFTSVIKRIKTKWGMA